MTAASVAATNARKSRDVGAHSDAVAHSFAGRSALLVEDQLVIALEAEDMLRAMGVEDLITVSTASDALRAVGASKIDFAVLDVNLGSHNSLAVADELKNRDIPFIFATGYGDSVMIPESLRSVPIVRKPYSEHSIRSGLEEAHSKGGSIPES